MFEFFLLLLLMLEENIQKIGVFAYSHAQLVEYLDHLRFDELGVMRRAVIEQREQRSMQLLVQQQVGLVIKMQMSEQILVVLQLFTLQVTQILGIGERPQEDDLEYVVLEEELPNRAVVDVE